MKRQIIIGAMVTVSSLLATTSAATAITVKVTVKNLVTANDGNYFSPITGIFHNGTYKTFTLNEPASEGIELQAEDGNASVLITNAKEAGFIANSVLNNDPTAPFGAIFPGDTGSQFFELDPNNPNHQYFSYASMFLPSNDAFIGNESSLEYQIFDNNGVFIPQNILISNLEVWDAGTEVNDETPPNAAIAGFPFTPGAGDDENGVVKQHPGYIPDGFFEQNNYSSPTNLTSVAQISVQAIPEPGTTATTGILGMGCLMFLSRKMRRKN